MDFGILTGWTITPDTLISLWVAISLTKVTNAHNLRITILEQERKMATKKQALKSDGTLKKGYRWGKGGRIIEAKKPATKRKTRR
ncbi:hypothetical protein NMS13_000620 [Vibrio cholerae]|nr:hypothetical protein [Vibrio cholerae]